MPQTPDQPAQTQPQPPIRFVGGLAEINVGTVVPVPADDARRCLSRLGRLSEIEEHLRAAECGIVYLERDPDVTSAVQTRMHDARIHVRRAMDLVGPNITDALDHVFAPDSRQGEKL